MKFHNLDTLKAYQSLSANKAVLRRDLTAERITSWQLPVGGGLSWFYGTSVLTESLRANLAELAEEGELHAKYAALLSGEIMNTGEKRMVLHHLTRGAVNGPVKAGTQDIGAFYREQQERVADFCNRVHSGALKGCTGQNFDTVVQIGIGGSDLGPRALYLALKGWASAAGSCLMDAQFISNVDPDDATDVLNRINPARTLFILVSKSGTTQETLTNREFVLAAARKKLPDFDPSRHMVAVTSRTSPLADSGEYLDSFYIDDNIGGRYSSTSSVGGVVLSLAFGPDVFGSVLAGAHEADLAAFEPDPLKNASMLDALIGMYYRNILSWPTTAILPYSQGLNRFPAHLQQLDMESNGKRVNREGESITYSTGPIIFGEPGTNGQHSFYQLLHQGTDIVPLQFIGFRNCQYGSDLNAFGSTSQQKLNANLAAQIIAFAKGQDNADANRQFPGERPSTLICGETLTPEALGALLAHFENKVMFQGFLWNINSFDQEGVQLGKVLTKSVLAGDMEDDALKSVADLLL